MARWDMGLVHCEICEFAILLQIGHACVILQEVGYDYLSTP